MADLALFNSAGFVTDCFHLNAIHDEVEIHAAAFGKLRGGQETEWRTWANGVQTMYSKTAGTHQDAFAKALETVGWQPKKAMIHVVMHQPQYAGPTKTMLNVPEKKASMISALTAALEEYRSKQK